VLNGFSVIVGTVTMTHFSIVHFPSPFALKSIFLNTLLADILLLWGNFFVGKALFDLETFGYDADRVKKGKPFRYPTWAGGSCIWRLSASFITSAIISGDSHEPIQTFFKELVDSSPYRIGVFSFSGPRRSFLK
jgi:hypothetical protein